MVNGQRLLNLQQLFSGEALMLYAGAALGFYGSRALHFYLVTPLVETLFKAEEGTVRKGLQNPNNYKEVVDVVVGSMALLVRNPNIQVGILAGAGLSLIDHILARFPETQALVTGGTV